MSKVVVSLVCMYAQQWEAPESMAGITAYQVGFVLEGEDTIREKRSSKDEQAACPSRASVFATQTALPTPKNMLY